MPAGPPMTRRLESLGGHVLAAEGQLPGDGDGGDLAVVAGLPPA
jgi:hypothetical protein